MKPRTDTRYSAAVGGDVQRGARGFTMAEVLFAIIILGLGLILLAAAFPVGVKQGEKVHDSTTAALVAQQAFDQINKVVASYARPTFVGGSWDPLPLLAPVANYVGKPVTMGLLDGAMVSDEFDTAAARNPDLRAKLLYPNWPSDVHPTNASDPTLSDGRPQDPSRVYSPPALPTPWLGLAAENDGSVVPATFLNVWGFRFDTVGAGIVWSENLQWVYAADRRYYWYAFYRQMYEDPAGYPNPVPIVTWDPSLLQQLTAIREDHITRRTYRVWIVAAKVPSGASPILAPQQMRAAGRTPQDYANQWYTGTAANQWYTGTAANQRPGLAPVRVPVKDGDAVPLTYAAPWLTDAAANDYIATGIAGGKIKRGGLMLDGWGEVYQIVDMTTNAVRLDRTLPGTVASLLPFWFNPNAIAVFPTIVTKQADLP
jgi:type II secretory pathway pseudopilin PulG